MKKSERQRTGFEFLECDTEIFNALIDAHRKYPSVIGRYNIQLINENYLQENQCDVNCLYVVRMESILVDTGFMYHRYNTTVQVIMKVSKYDTERALAFIKTTIKAIQQVLSKEPFSSHAKLERISPEYMEPGRLTGCVLTLTCTEIDEDVILCDGELEFGLKVRANIDHEKEYEKIFPPIEARPPLRRVKPRRDENEHFAGG